MEAWVKDTYPDFLKKVIAELDLEGWTGQVNKGKVELKKKKQVYSRQTQQRFEDQRTQEPNQEHKVHIGNGERQMKGPGWSWKTLKSMGVVL